MEITYSQLKQMRENCPDMWRDLLGHLQDQPAYLGEHMSISDIIAVNQGGCASGACMSAVTYHKALQTMNDHYDVIELELEASGIELDNAPVIDASNSWANLAAFYVSLAVELWCGQFQELFENVEH